MGKEFFLLTSPNLTGDRRQETGDEDRRQKTGDRRQETGGTTSHHLPCSPLLLLPLSPSISISPSPNPTPSLLPKFMSDQLPSLCSQMPTQIQQLLSLQLRLRWLIPTPQLLWLPIAVPKQGSCWVWGERHQGNFHLENPPPADETNHLDSPDLGRSVHSLVLALHLDVGKCADGSGICCCLGHCWRVILKRWMISMIDIDAINEPYRPFPGAISIQVVTQILVLLLAGIEIAFALDRWAGHNFHYDSDCTGRFISGMHLFCPTKLKRNGWLGNYALGASYIALPGGQVMLCLATSIGRSQFWRWSTAWLV